MICDRINVGHFLVWRLAPITEPSDRTSEWMPPGHLSHHDMLHRDHRTARKPASCQTGPSTMIDLLFPTQKDNCDRML